MFGRMRHISSVAVAAAIAMASPSSTQAQEREAVRQDALLLMGASVVVPGLAAYCNKYVATDARLMAAAVKWNQRNDAAMRLVLRAVEWSGGMSPEEREELDVVSLKLVRSMVTDSSGAICVDIVAPIEKGLADLDTREDTASAYQRLQRQFQ